MKDFKFAYQIKNGTGIIESLTIISEPDNEGYVQTIRGHYSKEDLKGRSLPMQGKKLMSKLVTRLSDKQQIRYNKILKSENENNAMLNEMNYIFHSMKDGSATDKENERFEKLGKNYINNVLNSL